MMNKKELLREELKKRGFNNRRVSVREEPGGLSWAFVVTVRDENVSILEIKDICKKFESIDYDERTMEILSGGNTFITVERPYDKPLDGSEYREIVQKALSELKDNYYAELINGWKINHSDDTRYCIFNSECYGLEPKIGRTYYLRYGGDEVADISRILKERDLDFEYLKRKNK